ncbi:gp181.1 [Bacillus phage W.Ph.]|uniref:Gp181.1 n=1 Tax=Bacillus phage W.Ph. TaxID=764595 RepID=L7UXL2_9CAUD|nr:gp181.1 [Bacillus phage W.Ph.]AGC55709.1 gp181.1 [Bacillus phage W.Ph.]
MSMRGSLKIAVYIGIGFALLHLYSHLIVNYAL